MPYPAVARLSTLLDSTASDPDQDPSERLSGLRTLRDDLATLVGQADRYIADQQALREGAAMSRVSDFMGARENARVRSSILANGGATPEQMDAGGYLSDDELDQRVADGTIGEAMEEFPMWEPSRADELADRIVEAMLRGDHREYAGDGRLEEALSQPSTADVYGRMVEGKRVYDKSRQGLHQGIVAGLLAGHAAQKKPTVTYSDSDAPDDAVVVDPDLIKKQIPEYASMLDSDDDEADGAVSDEADDVSQSLLAAGQDAGVNMVVRGDEPDDDDDPSGPDYTDLPDTSYDPDQDWRVAQLSYLRGQYGDFGPAQHGEFSEPVTEAVAEPDVEPDEEGNDA